MVIPQNNIASIRYFHAICITSIIAVQFSSVTELASIQRTLIIANVCMCLDNNVYQYRYRNKINNNVCTGNRNKIYSTEMYDVRVCRELIELLEWMHEASSSPS